MGNRCVGRRTGACVLVGALLAVAPLAAGVVGHHDQLFHRGTTGVNGTPSDGAGFGEALAWGDFDGDGYLDLAVGVPRSDTAVAISAGQIQVFHGAAGGLDFATDVVIDQDSPDVFGFPETDDAFGARLAAGDFDGDGIDDLAVGAPTEDIGTVQAAGAVWILPGTAAGLTGTGSVELDQSVAGVPGTVQDADLFGDALAAGDFDGDGVDELAIGIPQEKDGCTGQFDARGQVLVVRFPLSANRTFQTVGNTFLGGSLGCVDQFGRSLAAGDFDDDGDDDLAVGATGALVSLQQAAGRVWALEGGSGGILAGTSQTFDQGRFGIPDDPEALDFFGRVLAAGDFDGDGFADLAVGVPDEDLASPDRESAGVVHVLYGGVASLGVTGNQFLVAGSGGMAGTADELDGFGTALAAADLDGDGRAELLVGAPGEESPVGYYTGAFHVVPGAATGLLAAADLLFTLDSPGIVGDDADFLVLGDSLGARAGDASGFALVAVGLPGLESSPQIQPGSVLRLYGALFASDLDEPGDGTTEWSATTP